MKVDKGNKGELEEADIIDGFVDILGIEDIKLAEKSAREVMLRLRKRKITFS